MQYKSTNPERVDPEFIGIAQKYSQHRKKRIESEQERRKVENNHNYMLKMEESMEKQLKEKKRELTRLKNIRHRHNEDIRNKKTRQEKEQEQLNHRKQLSQELRFNLKNGLEETQHQYNNDKNKYCNKNKETLRRWKEEFYEQKQLIYEQNCTWHNRIEMGKKNGKQQINKFHRSKNKVSLDTYLTRINNEEKKNNEHQRRISELKNSIQLYEEDLNQKQAKLQGLLDQISYYSVETKRGRKSNHAKNRPKSLNRNIQSSSSSRSTPLKFLQQYVF